jgi:hypothetical protein
MKISLTQILSMPINWISSEDSPYCFYFIFEGEKISLRLNDFPAEPLCSLFYGDQVVDLDDMPLQWTLPNHRKGKLDDK